MNTRTFSFVPEDGLTVCTLANAAAKADETCRVLDEHIRKLRRAMNAAIEQRDLVDRERWTLFSAADAAKGDPRVVPGVLKNLDPPFNAVIRMTVELTEPDA